VAILKLGHTSKRSFKYDDIDLLLFVLLNIHEDETYCIIALLFSRYARKLMANHAAIGSVRLVRVILSRWCIMELNTAICKLYAKLIT